MKLLHVSFAVAAAVLAGAVFSCGSNPAKSTVGKMQEMLAGAGDGGAGPSAPQGPSVVIEPQDPETTPGGTLSFTATVTGESNTAVTWSLSGPDASAVGSIDANGVFTAASGASGSVTVVATSVASSSLTGSTTVQIVAPSSIDPGGLLPVDRATTWQPGVTYNGGIPARATICKTLSPLGGTSDDTTQIQNAVNACPAGQTVLLEAGTFNVNGTAINMKSNVTLRGSGPGTTILNSTGTGTPGTVIMVGTLYYHYIDGRNLTADAVKDSNSVTVADATGLAVGEIVAVNELYDPNLTDYTNTTQTTGGDYLGWGECRCYHSDGSCRTDDGTNCPVLSGAWTAAGAMAASRPVGQVMEIASVSGNTVTFTTPFHQNYRVDHTAHIARFGHSDNSLTQVVTGVGIEELTIENGGGGDPAGPLAFDVVSHSWARHVEVVHGQAVNVLFSGSFQCELRDSYIHETTNPNPGGAGYGIGIDAYSADNLVENTISWSFNKVMVMRSSGGGNVIAYNYMQDGYGMGYPTLPEVGLNASHMATSHHELFEGNEAHNFSSDTTWGNTIYVTALRNHLTALRIAHPGVLAALSDQGNRRAIDISTGDRWFSFIGNVLGCSASKTCANAGDSTCKCAGLNVSMPGGMTGQTSWQYEPTADNATDARMWQLMYADSTAQSTLLRLGNFDWVTSSQKWPGLGGIGTPDMPPNPLPTIPNSFYLTSKPPFMGSNPWPWVDPSTGTTYVLPARARFDAGTPNTL